VATGKPPLVTGEQARLVMQVYRAADLSAETGQPVDLTAAAGTTVTSEPTFA
jgi:predicted dehydrogenase